MYVRSQRFGYGVSLWVIIVSVEVLQPSQPNGVMLSMVSLPNHRLGRLSPLSS